MTFEERLIGLEAQEAWDRALTAVPHGYWHTWRGCNAVQKSLDTPIYLYAYHDKVAGGRAACPLLERQWRGAVDLCTPGAFSGFAHSGPVPELRKHWYEFVRSRGYVCGYFALHPVLADPANHGGISVHNDLYVIDLSEGAGAMLRRASENVQRSVRSWARAGTAYVTDRVTLAAFLRENYHSFMRTSGARDSTIWPMEALNEMLADPAVLLVGASDDEGICTAMTFATTPYCAEYHLNVSVRDGKRFTAPLMWWGVQQLEMMGIRWLNLGGGAARNDSLAKAKERYGPARLPFRSAREIYRPEEYQRLCRIADQDPENTSYFPAYRSGASST
jgi:hypothetical protein